MVTRSTEGNTICITHLAITSIIKWSLRLFTSILYLLTYLVYNEIITLCGLIFQLETASIKKTGSQNNTVYYPQKQTKDYMPH